MVSVSPDVDREGGAAGVAGRDGRVWHAAAWRTWLQITEVRMWGAMMLD